MLQKAITIWFFLLVSACAHSRAPLAQACSPGMSCFGKVVLLPNGEVAAAVVAGTAAAATGAAVATSADKAKASEKAKTKAEPKVQLKRKITCKLIGGGVPKQGKIRCTYHCPGDPPGVTQEVPLDIKICPDLWDFHR